MEKEKLINLLLELQRENKLKIEVFTTEGESVVADNFGIDYDKDNDTIYLQTNDLNIN